MLQQVEVAASLMVFLDKKLQPHQVTDNVVHLVDHMQAQFFMLSVIHIFISSIEVQVNGESGINTRMILNTISFRNMR